MNDIIAADKLDLENVEMKIDDEALERVKAKIHAKLKIAIHEKVRGKPDIEQLTEEEIVNLENELLTDMEQSLEEEFTNM